jgi:hypothetical protein
MNRRRLLQAWAGTGLVAAAGCLGAGDGTTSTASSTTTATPSPPGTGPQLEYTLSNEDDQSHEVDVSLATADGTVVAETTRSLPASESFTETTTGHDPARGPYEFTVALTTLATSLELQFDECPAYNLGLSITADASLSVDREVCQK